MTNYIQFSNNNNNIYKGLNNMVVSKRTIVCLQITNQNLNEYMNYKSVLFSINHTCIIMEMRSNIQGINMYVYII